MSIKTRATINDLYKVEGKAELVNGEIVHMSPTGGMPGRASGRVYRSLNDYERVAEGYAFPNADGGGGVVWAVAPQPSTIARPEVFAPGHP